MDPLTPLETLCRIILRAREYEAQTPTDYDGNEAAENVDDEGEGTLSVLDDTLNDSVEEELKAVFEDLGEDQLAAHAPLRRLGDDEDLKGTCVLFASDAGKHITGQWLAVDGGARIAVWAWNDHSSLPVFTSRALKSPSRSPWNSRPPAVDSTPPL